MPCTNITMESSNFPLKNDANLEIQNTEPVLDELILSLVLPFKPNRSLGMKEFFLFH